MDKINCILIFLIVVFQNSCKDKQNELLYYTTKNTIKIDLKNDSITIAPASLTKSKFKYQKFNISNDEKDKISYLVQKLDLNDYYATVKLSEMETKFMENDIKYYHLKDYKDIIHCYNENSVGGVQDIIQITKNGQKKVIFFDDLWNPKQYAKHMQTIIIFKRKIDSILIGNKQFKNAVDTIKKITIQNNQQWINPSSSK